MNPVHNACEVTTVRKPKQHGHHEKGCATTSSTWLNLGVTNDKVKPWGWKIHRFKYIDVLYSTGWPKPYIKDCPASCSHPLALPSWALWLNLMRVGNLALRKRLILSGFQSVALAFRHFRIQPGCWKGLRSEHGLQHSAGLGLLCPTVLAMQHGFENFVGHLGQPTSLDRRMAREMCSRPERIDHHYHITQ
jgi:hypothetical protein